MSTFTGSCWLATLWSRISSYVISVNSSFCLIFFICKLGFWFERIPFTSSILWLCSRHLFPLINLFSYRCHLIPLNNTFSVAQNFQNIVNSVFPESCFTSLRMMLQKDKGIFWTGVHCLCHHSSQLCFCTHFLSSIIVSL